MTFVKAVIGLSLGIALLSALQTAGLWSLQQYLTSDRTNVGLPAGMNTPVVTKFDTATFKGGILPNYGPIDTKEGQRLGVESAARRVDMQVRNAQSAAPAPRSFFGVPRY